MVRLTFLITILPYIVLPATAAAAPKAPKAPDTVVDLGYAKYQGTVLPAGTTEWLGMRYAAPPLGDLRFDSPQNPLREEGTIKADKHGPTCLATGGKPDNPKTSEDCLFIDVYAPSKATSSSNLPVFFYIQGGGFNSNSNANYDGTGLILASDMKMVVVNFNYRVGPYGFLAGKELRNRGSFNNGLKDQIKALEWVQKYIKQFGGNPDHVVIGGNSAGAASVSLLLTAYGGKNYDLFHGAYAGSPSFGSMLTIDESQYMYDGLVKRTGCDKESDTLKCLRKLETSTLQKHNIKMPRPGADKPPLFMYSVTIDKDLVQDYTYRLFHQGKFIDVPMIVGSDLNEGTIFAPKATKSLKECDAFLRTQYPALKPEHLEKIHSYFPKTDDKFPNSGPYWRQTSNAYGEMRYTCPAMSMAQSLSESGGFKKSWSYEYAVETPPAIASGTGVGHTAEVPSIWGPLFVGGPKSYLKGGENAPIVPIMQGYFASFIRSLNPNTHRAKGAPEWKSWSDKKDKGSGFRRLRVKTGDTKVEVIKGKKRERCEYLVGIGVDIKQ
ncbi:hypothetical protein AJ80_04462 [Polytolypa hystricis UAMH7299]|uniref:Carboxylic ester hydrolase n=1 Tax=Polytolypa hystricis (strain UAMH7299) TaxID=1447883 RepID=A0A2B7YCA0_POLH7|nr:hypothetical protein AJ80_04462 [Polytolypa hystricis UAMH7299]